MKRTVIVCLSPLLVGSASPASNPQMPSVVEAGRVAANLSDWQTIAFFLMFIIVVGSVERWVAGWHSRATAAKLADAVDRLGQAMLSQGTELKVTLALIQQQLGDHRGGD